MLLGAAAEAGLRGACLLGEMPQVFAQLPFPKASQAVLKVFGAIANIEVDLTELAEQTKDMEQKLGELLAQMEQALGQQVPTEEEAVGYNPAEGERLGSEHEPHLEELFARAASDRSAAYELKRELDRLGVYPEYEDRFLDLFKKPE